jgi:RNA polymerase sigma-70 factor (ECF subfamily)
MNENQLTSDGFSLQALQSGDKAEFARLVDQYSTKIYHLALKMLNDEQDAEDILQETFIKASRSFTGFESRSSLATWLYRIAVNEALMLMRKRRPDIVSTDLDVETEDGQMEPIQIVDWCCLPERELLSGETKKVLNLAIEKLPKSLLTVFTLRDLNGLSIKETASALNLTETAVKTRLLRARLRLRAELSSYFMESESRRSTK